MPANFPIKLAQGLTAAPGGGGFRGHMLSSREVPDQRSEYDALSGTNGISDGPTHNQCPQVVAIDAVLRLTAIYSPWTLRQLAWPMPFTRSTVVHGPVDGGRRTRSVWGFSQLSDLSSLRDAT